MWAWWEQELDIRLLHSWIIHLHFLLVSYKIPTQLGMYWAPGELGKISLDSVLVLLLTASINLVVYRIPCELKLSVACIHEFNTLIHSFYMDMMAMLSLAYNFAQWFTRGTAAKQFCCCQELHFPHGPYERDVCKTVNLTRLTANKANYDSFYCEFLLSMEVLYS